LPFGNIVMKPGVDVQSTPTLSDGRWNTSNLIRFKDGMLQKLGGWGRMSQSVCIGTVRGMHPYADLAGNLYLALGSDQRLQCLSSSGLNDITPFRPVNPTNNSAVNFSTVINTPNVKIVDGNSTVLVEVGDWIQIVNPIAVGGIVLQNFYIVNAVTNVTTYTVTAQKNATSTVNNGGSAVRFDSSIGLTTVTVTEAAHGYVPGDDYYVFISTTVSNITLLGEYLVQTTPTLDTFTIDQTTAAAATANINENGGNVRINYLFSSGDASSIAVTGYGSGTYGSGTWGISTASGIFTKLRQWSLDNWGEFLVACPADSPIYIWQPSGGYTTPAALLTQGPTKNHQVFVSNPTQIMIALGSETGGIQDHMLVRWCEVSDYTIWTATATNQAGSFRLPNGSEIVGGMTNALQIYLWTDVDLWSMQYQGQPFIFGFQQISAACGLLSMRSVAMVGNKILWLGLKSFFVMSGGQVNPLQCSVWDKLFPLLNSQQRDKCFAAPNSMFSEVAWYYPSTNGTGEVDSYVKYNYAEDLWDYGSLVRTAWTNTSVWGAPIGVDGSGYIQQHETSNDADGGVLNAWAESGDIDISNGEDFVFVDYVVFDATLSGTGTPSVNLTFNIRDFPFQADRTQGPYSITATSTDATPRMRGRQMSFKFESTGAGSFWRVGRCRYRYAPDGRR